MTTLEKIRAEIEQSRYGLVNDGLDLALKIIDKYAEQEPCDDVVSRQAALDLAEKGILVSNGSYKSVCKAINELPPVRPQEQTGHWIETEYHRWRCSVCREKGMSEWDNIHDVRTNFCPNCGAKMIEPTCDTCKYNTTAFMPCNACKDKSEYEPQERSDKE